MRKSELNEVVNKKEYALLLPKYLSLLTDLQKKYKVIDREDYFSLVNFKKNASIGIHNWFDYKQGYSFELVQKIINLEKPNKSTIILDPFTGVGTTNVVAQQNGYDSIGFDVNPVAAFSAKVKTTYYSNEDLIKIKKAIDGFRPIKSKKIPVAEFLIKSFNEKTFNELMLIKGYWESMSDEKVQNIFRLAYISILEDCSYRVKDGNGIKVVKNKKIPENIQEFYLKKVSAMVNEITPDKNRVITKIIEGSFIDVTEIEKIKGSKIGLVVFSPPYANCFDYCEVYKLELWLGGFIENYSDLKKYRSNAIRSHVNSSFNHSVLIKDETVNTISSLISCFNIWNKNIPDMLRGYFDDMRQTLTILKSLMLKDSRCFIVVANSGYRGILVPTDLLLAKIASEIGFEVCEIWNARKIRASSQQMKILHNDYAKLMRESIIVVKKR